ncbi:PREDICTED: polycomb protein suz12-B-like [Acropora digitifera]|uniref:polycomb protein suz12-B-like n=1 Tax=Acropora digitifera TaxID=70779 RepID=UPI00077ABF79|nr:PREDICTED: polycomb protein suz12-B-like [Acropora digitifera]
MTTEKSEGVYPSPKKTKFEQLRADHELFLQAFEKPTQIYRFLRTRNAVAPVFLHRTLSYMKHRRTPRSGKKRKDFKVDNMLEKVQDESSTLNSRDPLESSGFMNLTFSGFYHGSGPVNGDLAGSRKSSLLVEDFIKVDVLLVKVCHKRRKETDPQVVTVPLGQGSAPFNPRSQLLPASPSASVSVPNGTFKSGKTSRTCILSLQVSVPYRIHSKGPKKKRKKSTVGAQSDLGEAENGMDKTVLESGQSFFGNSVLVEEAMSVLTLKSAFRSCKLSVSFQPHSKGERIDVSVNENYDGSYYGKPEDMNDLLGYALSREGPCRRLSNTHVMVWRPQRRRESLSEFLEPDDGEYDANRPFYNGHHRMYFHSKTKLPIRSAEKDQDSEDETIPEWMRAKTIQVGGVQWEGLFSMTLRCHSRQNKSLNRTNQKFYQTS